LQEVEDVAVVAVDEAVVAVEREALALQHKEQQSAVEGQALCKEPHRCRVRVLTELVGL
jgi:hypothetical protein